MKKRTRGSVGSSPLLTILIRVAFVFASVAILSLIGAAVLSALNDPVKGVGIASLAALVVGGGLSGYINSRGKGNISSSVIVTVISAAIMLAVSLVLNGGGIKGGALMNLLCYALVSLFFAYIGGRRCSRARKRR